MHEREGGNDVAPEKAVPTAQREREDHPGKDAEMVMAIEEPELRIARQVRHPLDGGLVVFSTEPPSHMRVPEPALHRAMHVFGRIGILVMTPMRGCPPKWPLLRRRRAEQRQ